MHGGAGGGSGLEVVESLPQNGLWLLGDYKVNKITLSHGANRALDPQPRSEPRALLTRVPGNLFVPFSPKSMSQPQSAPPTPSIPSLEMAFTRLQRKPVPSLRKQKGLEIRAGKGKRRDRDQAASAR